MENQLEIEIFNNDKWQSAATLSCPDHSKGYRSASSLVYKDQYIEEHLLKNDICALSCRYPVSFEFHKASSWPAFILDIMPSGAGRRFWLAKLELPNNAFADWSLLASGSSNSPGNIRIKNLEESSLSKKHSGFNKSEILERNENFVSYALERGAPITGSSGAQGDAPKFLLTEDKNGMWHADGSLSDAEVKKHWIVKFPRGKHETDRKILRNEAQYMKIAYLLGLKVGELPYFEDDALFIPRFDRQVINSKNKQSVVRLGLETLCSASGISDFGHIFKLEDLCTTIATFSSNPFNDIVEFIKRDFLNIICGNTDNHGRNTSLLKLQDGSICLSPLYDFAPMYLDREGIARLNKWRNFETSGSILVSKLLEWVVVEFKFNKKRVISTFDEFRDRLKLIPNLLLDLEMDQEIKLRINESFKIFEKNW